MKVNYNYNLRVLMTALLLFMTPLMLWAQERTIGGKVVDQMGVPLPGVSIVLKGTTKGSISDLDGAYKLSIPGAGATLVFSYIGYQSKEVPVGTQTTVNVTMDEDAAQLEEVVVIGYGSVKKEDMTGSIQSVKASDFNQGAITSPQELIVGKMPGVQVTTNGGAPGAGATIRIRGGSSLSASNDPLIIIDGMPVDNGGISGASNPLATINPADIETFTVLKDASATAIYGSRASNGVILITTKRGAQGGLKVDYAGNVSVSSPVNTIDVLNAEQFRNEIVNFYGADSKQAQLLGTSSTNWQKEVLRTAVSTDHNVSVGGNIKDLIPYRASVGYNNSNGILETSNMQRTTVGLNMNPKFFDNHLKVDASMKYTNSKNRFADTGAIGNALSMDPTQATDFFWMTEEDGKVIPNNNAPKNPLSLLNDKSDNSNVNRFLGNIQLDYKFHFLPDLRANLNLGYDYSKGEGNTQIQQDQAFDLQAFEKGGSYSSYSQIKKNELLDFYLAYVKELPAIQSRIEATAGYSWQHFWWENYNDQRFLGSQADGKPWDPASPARTSRQENYLVSFFGRVNYTLMDRYLLTATLRADGSSKFAKDNRWGYFPAAAFAWNIKKEAFLADAAAVSALKLRLGYGITGQQDIGSNYGYMPVFNYGQVNAAYTYMVFNPATGKYEKRVVNTLRPQGYDPGLRWEQTTTYNAGIDYGFLNDRINGSIEVYKRITDDLLNNVPIPVGSNLTNELITNVGSLENKGIELAINAKLIQNAGLYWDFGVNATYNQNKITRLTSFDDPNYLGVLTGGVSSGTGNTAQIHSVGYPAGTFFVYEQVYGENGKPIEGMVVDRNGDGKIDEADRYRTGQSAPKLMLGFNTKLTYKNWDFSASARAQFGAYVYNDVNALRGFKGAMQMNTGFISNVTTDIYETGFTSNGDTRILSDHYVQKADFFRLDNVMVGYNFPKLLGGKYHLRVYGTVNNALVVTPYKGLDPEVFGGIDNNIYPRPRTFLVGVNMSL